MKETSRSKKVSWLGYWALVIVWLTLPCLDVRGQAFGNPKIQDEGLTSYEAGYWAVLSRRFSIDLAAYFNDYDKQNSSEPAPPFCESTPLPAHLVIPFMQANLLEGQTHGAEVVAKWKVTSKWTLTPSYDFERIHMHRRAGAARTWKAAPKPRAAICINMRGCDCM
jgi:outer membrane cobalamin receptor